MPKTTKVSQKKWIRGVNAASQIFAQPPGSYPRGSNLIYNKRGALVTSDGSLFISAIGGVIHPASDNIGPITEIYLYAPQGGPYTYFTIHKDYLTQIAPPVGLAAALGGGGVLVGTYKYVITALDGAGGETTASNEVTITPASQSVNLTWTADPAAAGGFSIYRTFSGGAAGTERFVATVPAGTTSYNDNLGDGGLGGPVPVVNSTQVSQFSKITTGAFPGNTPVKQFPADNLVFNPGPPGGGGGAPGGGGGGGGGGGQQGGGQPAGGQTGNISPLPQILGFKNLMVLLLGNGFPPYSSDGTNANTIALVNNFQASYASRTASTAQNVGDQIAVLVGGTNYIFTCTQAGTTAAGAGPAFSAIESSVVADGTVYWKNSGKVAVAIAPRGAAHGIVYAGSLWIANTTPLTTTDNLDGPSCLKMSDLNNPNSWNPLNVAFLDRDDGTQIQGLATFTLAESGIPPTGSLVVFKDFSTFQVNGVFGASNFSIQRAQTDMGCIAPRSIQFVPGYGIVRLSHLGFAVFDGVRDRLLSEEIRPYLFGGQPDIVAMDWGYAWFSKGAQTAIPPMYVCVVPLIGVPSPIFASVVVQNVLADQTFKLTSGSYYIRVQANLTTGQQLLSAEYVISFLNRAHANSQGIYITLPVDPTVSTWQIFVGLTAGGENKYVTVAGGVTEVILVNSTSYTSGVPHASLGGQMTRIFCYDLVLRAWAIADLPFPISVLHQFRAGGTYPITVAGGFSDGVIRRWNGGAGVDQQWDGGAVNNGAPDALVRWVVRSPEVFGRNASDRVYFRELALRGFGNPLGISAQVTVNGSQGPLTLTRNVTTQPMAGNEFVGYVDVGLTGVDAYAALVGAGPIEIDSLDWFAVAKQLRARVAV